jgi:hypothetical protein
VWARVSGQRSAQRGIRLLKLRDRFVDDSLGHGLRCHRVREGSLGGRFPVSAVEKQRLPRS